MRFRWCDAKRPIKAAAVGQGVALLECELTVDVLSFVRWAGIGNKQSERIFEVSVKLVMIFRKADHRCG